MQCMACKTCQVPDLQGRAHNFEGCLVSCSAQPPQLGLKPGNLRCLWPRVGALELELGFLKPLNPSTLKLPCVLGPTRPLLPSCSVYGDSVQSV